jgi:DNA mismatch endonuclease, patch repair protein
MADVHDKTTRSYNMSMIRAKDTKPELIIRKFLFSKGYRYRLNDKKLPGKPDLVIHKYKTVIFVNGCFWHGHETKTQWWKDKIDKTKQNDIKNGALLKAAGWKVISIFECELKKNVLQETLGKLLNELH